MTAGGERGRGARLTQAHKAGRALTQGSVNSKVFEGEFSSVASAINDCTFKDTKRLSFQFSVWGEE